MDSWRCRGSGCSASPSWCCWNWGGWRWRRSLHLRTQRGSRLMRFWMNRRPGSGGNHSLRLHRFPWCGKRMVHRWLRHDRRCLCRSYGRLMCCRRFWQRRYRMYILLGLWQHAGLGLSCCCRRWGGRKQGHRNDYACGHRHLLRQMGHDQQHQKGSRMQHHSNHHRPRPPVCRRCGQRFFQHINNCQICQLHKILISAAGQPAQALLCLCPLAPLTRCTPPKQTRCGQRRDTGTGCRWGRRCRYRCRTFRPAD